jgi:hypothetical protein
MTPTPSNFANVTCWTTGAAVRMCACGSGTLLPSPGLPVCTDGKREWASCPTCGKTWDMKTMKEWAS